MMPDHIIEMIAILSMAVSVPMLARAMWHGWNFEKYRSEQECAPVDERTPPWN